MNTVRYVFALILLVGVPPMLLFWLLIHPLVRLWRRLGPGWTYGLVGAAMAGLLAGLVLARRPLLATEFGTSSPLSVLGVLCLAGATAMFVSLKRQLTLRTQAGAPELAPERHPQALLTEGIYARIRHPRYVELMLALLGYALIANYLAGYVAFGLYVAGIYVVTTLEERELRQRFGEEYDAYRRRVPRFVPRLRTRPARRS